MRHYSVWVAIAAALICGQANAQGFTPRSLDYLFAATARDARAIWVNPAGLAVVPEASIYAELALERPEASNLRLSQISLGFNSQGLSFGYHRQRLVSDSSNHVYRLAIARALQGWSLGFSVSHIRAGDNATGFDAGIQYRLTRALGVGFVMRNIGEPQLRSDTLPLTGVASIGFAALPGRLLLSAETSAASRPSADGYDMRYSAGARFGFGNAAPIVALAAIHLDSDIGVASWVFGLSIGGTKRGILTAGVVPDDPARLETVGITAMAVNDLTRRR